MLVCVSFVHFCTRDRGCSAHPVFPAPSNWRVRNFLANLGRYTRRDREAVSANDVPTPAKAGIQYSRVAEINSRGRSVLDRPVKPDDDSSLWWPATTTLGLGCL